MSTYYKDQKDLKPKPEDVAGNILDAERAADLLNFAEFLRANKIGIRWISSNSWTLAYKGRRLGYLKIKGVDDKYKRLFGEPYPLDKSWLFCQQVSYQQSPYLDRYYSMDDCDLKSFVFDHIYARGCGRCFCTWDINGKASLNEEKAGYMNPTQCGCWPLRIYNPNGESLELTKQLIEFWMERILEEKQGLKS